jgi:4-hydroxy-3-polyprenylbenzoate decarboxylase
VRRLVVGITGASGTVYGVEMLKMLADAGVETHLVMTKSAIVTMRLETDHEPDDVRALASQAYALGDLAAPVSSGSFRTDGMVVAPCSIKSLSGIVNCYEDNLLLRAAGVTLKESRPLVLMLRETPLHVGQIRLMYEAAQMGVRILPPVPAFYNRPKTIDDLVRHSCARAMDQFGLDAGIERWRGRDDHRTLTAE